MSHSFSTISAYRIAIVNQNKTGFRDYLQELHNIDELEFVDKVKQEKFDVYATLRDHVVFLDNKNYKPKSKGGTDYLRNLVAACVSCNRDKSARGGSGYKRNFEHETFGGRLAKELGLPDGFMGSSRKKSDRR